jgi:plasmid stability protein
MSDLLIRNIDPHLKQQLEKSARAHRRSLSEEARMLLKKAVVAGTAQPEKGMFTAMRELVPEECRSDDLVFEIPGDVSEPPDFE